MILSLPRDGALLPPWAPVSPDTDSFTFTFYHTWQFTIVTVFTVTTLVLLKHSVFYSELKTWLLGKSFPA